MMKDLEMSQILKAKEGKGREGEEIGFEMVEWEVERIQR